MAGIGTVVCVLLQILLLGFTASQIKADNDREPRILQRDSSDTCDFTQFGANHSAVLPPEEKCEKFRLIAGEIYKRGVSEEDIEAILRTHNEMRSKGWADQCAVKHDKRPNRRTCKYKQVGQNVGHKKSQDKGPSTVQWEKIINNLHNEVDNMPDYAVDKMLKPPKGNIGHYTQIIWAKTYEVGCGVVYYYLYKEEKGKLKQSTARSFVCNYGPSGNYKGGQVYQRGPPASNCDNGVSSHYPNLCAPPAN